MVSHMAQGPESELPGVQVCVPSWIITTSTEALFSCHKSESCKINSCHNKGCSSQITSQHSTAPLPQRTLLSMSVWGRDSIFMMILTGGLSGWTTLVYGDKSWWPLQLGGVR